MSSFLFWRILIVCSVLCFSLCAWEVSTQEAEMIGKRIYLNECNAKLEKLVWWNEGEDFASLGIGHFIWYPMNKKGPFEETFPSLLNFFRKSGIEMPNWLQNAEGCPWNSKEDYLASDQEMRKKELQDLLAHSISSQVIFIAQRFEEALPQLLLDLNAEQKSRVTKQIDRLWRSLQGKYALLDYLNFKGKGLAASERYRGEGWGLKQVLEKMPDNEKDPLLSFIETAKALLRQRVRNAPVERNEQRWLPGWIVRIDSYQQALI